MAKKPTKKSIALAVSAALAASTMAGEDKCGEGKCGGRLLDQSPVYSGFIRQVTCCDNAMPNTSTVCGAHKKGPPVS
jgi:uncharacterized low-complexity protein